MCGFCVCEELFFTQNWLTCSQTGSSEQVTKIDCSNWELLFLQALPFGGLLCKAEKALDKCKHSVPFISSVFYIPGTGKKEKMRRGMTQSSAKAKSTPMMSIKIFSDTLGVQNITKQSWKSQKIVHD